MSEEKPARHLHPAVVIGVVGVIAVLAALPWLLGDDPVEEPATLSTYSPSPVPTRAPAPTPTSTPTPSPTPTPTGASSPDVADPTDPEDPTAGSEQTTVSEGASLDGRVAVSDDPGDVVDTAGEPPPDAEPAVDLVEVALRGDGDALAVTFQTDGPVPQGGPRSLVWSIDLYAAGEPRYTVTVQQLGARRFTGLLDWETLEQTDLPEEPEIEGSRISVRIPAALLPHLPVPFRWQALGQVDGGYEDRAPDGRQATFGVG